MRALHAASPALEIRHLTKRYGAHLALDDVDLVVAPGTVVGLLGPNGAGKTTLMRIALGLIAADAGTVTIAGRMHPGRGATANGVAGFVDVPRFYPFMSGRRNLELLAHLDCNFACRGSSGLPPNRGGSSRDRVNRAIASAELSAADAHVTRYSAGMRQRLAIAAALLRSPRLLLLDEPTSSLDAASARDIRTLVRELAAEGVAVVLSSHDMSEVERLCSSVTVLESGRARFSGSIDEMRSGSRDIVFLHTSNDEGAIRLAREQPDLTVAAVHDDGMEIVGGREGLDRFVIVLGYAGIAVRSLERRGQTLEAALLRMTDPRVISERVDRTRTRHDEATNPRRFDGASTDPRDRGQANRRATVRGVLSVVRVEWLKMSVQRWTWIVVALGVLAPWAFVVALRVQDSVPEDTLFGRSVKESGLAVPLVVLGFAAAWILPATAAVVAGDIFSAEDRHGTWSSILTRSRTRFEIFAGKVLVALTCAAVVVLLVGLSSSVAGIATIGHQPLVDLSGALMPFPRASVGIAAAWASVIPPLFAFGGLAVLLSVWTRRSTASVGLPVVAGLLMQLTAFVNGPESVRRLVVTSAFGAWHGLLNEHPYDGPLISGTIVSIVYCGAALALGYRLFRQRDIA